MQISNYILTYDRVFHVGIYQVGVKARNVTRCSGAGFRVPRGIVLPVQAFRSFVRGETLNSLFQKIAQHFAATETLIVRSSAPEEDTAELSFAGQYLSMVCPNTATSIKAACEACWSSYYATNVEAYHKAMKQTGPEPDTGMALLIQNLVNASTAGVCFTKDPMKDRRDIFVINAVHGLGEAVVNGEVVSDHYEFDIRRGSVIRRITAKQTHWRSPECPQELRPLSRELLNKSVLSINQIKEVVRMAQSAVELFKNPLDIEWAYEGKKLFLLQVRPVTTVAKKGEYELWTRDNVADVIPDAVTPLTWSVVKKATNNGFKNLIRELGLPHEPTTLFKVFDGRVYFNKTAYRKILDIRSENSKVPALLFRICRNYLSLLFTLRNKVSNLEETFSEGLSATIVKSRVSTIKGLRNYLSKYMATHILVAVLMDIGFLFIRRLMSKNVQPTEVSCVISNLVIGLNEIESTASRAGLWQLACLIREDEKLAETIQNSPVQSVPDILKTSGGVCADRWYDFLDLYGHSSLREFEIYYPRWKDDPGFVAATLKNYIAESANIDLKVSQRTREERRRESEQTLLKMSPLPCRPLLRYYTKHVQQCTIWRESIKQKIVKIMAEIRTQVTGFARDKGIKPDDAVFFLTLSEIAEYENDPIPSHIIEEIDRRRNQWQKWGKKKPFREIRVFGNGQTAKIPHLTRSGNSIQGLGLSSGKYTGRARIILDPNDVDSFNKGDILVTRSTNPSWTPLFTLAGAIVTDMGNYLSHGAIVARELGIPAVGNLLDATTRIMDGQLVKVDGDSGTIILSEKTINDAVA